MKRLRQVIHASLIALGIILLLGGLVSAAASLLWEDVVDFAAHDDQPLGLALTGPHVIAVGAVRTASGVPTFYVRATNALDGTLQWDDRVEFSGGPFRATDVAVGGPRAFVVGQGDATAGDPIRDAPGPTAGRSAPEHLGSPLNSTATDFSPALSPNGRALYFASARPDTQGNFDLYVTTRSRIR
jgi:hypothetical protein